MGGSSGRRIDDGTERSEQSLEALLRQGRVAAGRRGVEMGRIGIPAICRLLAVVGEIHGMGDQAGNTVLGGGNARCKQINGYWAVWDVCVISCTKRGVVRNVCS